MKQLTANVFIETELKGANHGFVTTSDGIVLIDTPHKPSDAMRLKGEISRHGRLRYSHCAPERIRRYREPARVGDRAWASRSFLKLPAAKRSRRRTPGAAYARRGVRKISFE